MRNTTKVVLFILFSLIVIEIVLIAPQTLDPSPENQSEFVESEEADGKVEQLIRGVHLVESSPEGKEWELWSDEAKTLKGKRAWKLTKVRAKFFGKDGIIINVVGKQGEVNVKTKNMVIKGNVITNTSNGYEFKTNVISYSSKERSLSSKGEVIMLGPKDTHGKRMNLTGQDLFVYLDTSLININREVNAEKVFHDEKRLNISSQRAEFSAASNYARFLDNVIIDFETMRLTGPDAVFNYDEKEKMFTSMNVQGGVKVSDLDKWATSSKVFVEFASEKFIFKGNPRVVQNNDELRGNEIIFYDGGSRVKVKNTKAKMRKGRLEGK